MAEYAACRAECRGAMVWSEFDQVWICLKCGFKFTDEYIRSKPLGEKQKIKKGDL